jgi:hypothetical protein
MANSGAERAAIYRAKWRSKGLCEKCGSAPPAYARRACERCYRVQKTASQRLRDRGLCIGCGAAPASKGLSICDGCRTKSAERRRELSVNGICQRCGKQPINFDRSAATCEQCLNRQLAATTRRRKESHAAGKCVRCRRENRVDNHYCERCWFEHRAKANGTSAESLRAIWTRQGGRCALSGVELSPGSDASVDHVIPVCRGGCLDESNLQWVALQVNYSKRDRTNEEFIAMCKAIATTARSCE